MTTTLDTMRSWGWMVAVHNDYMLNGERFTFWLFTHPDGRYIKGEGRSDFAALEECYRLACRSSSPALGVKAMQSPGGLAFVARALSETDPDAVPSTPRAEGTDFGSQPGNPAPTTPPPAVDWPPRAQRMPFGSPYAPDYVPPPHILPATPPPGERIRCSLRWGGAGLKFLRCVLDEGHAGQHDFYPRALPVEGEPA